MGLLTLLPPPPPCCCCCCCCCMCGLWTKPPIGFMGEWWFGVEPIGEPIAPVPGCCCCCCCGGCCCCCGIMFGGMRLPIWPICRKSKLKKGQNNLSFLSYHSDLLLLHLLLLRHPSLLLLWHSSLLLLLRLLWHG